jgi:hypothetical protein
VNSKEFLSVSIPRSEVLSKAKELPGEDTYERLQGPEFRTIDIAEKSDQGKRYVDFEQ